MKQKNGLNPRPIYTVIIFLSLIGIGIVLRRTLHLTHVLVNGYQPPVKVSNPRLQSLLETDDLFAHYPILTLIHILPGLLFIGLGPFQFNRGLRRRHPKWHRRSGRVFLVSGLIIGITGFVMSIAMPAIGGVNQAASTLLFSILFVYSLTRAYRYILQRKIALHREWMIRTYAIGLAVTTIRPIVGIFFATSSWTGSTPREFFGTAFWIGFVLHLIIAEAWIYKTRPGIERDAELI